MNKHDVLISIPDCQLRMAGMLIRELKLAIERAELDGGLNVNPSIKKESSDTQDMGSILQIILSAEATIIISKAISFWMQRNNQTKLTLKDKDGNQVIIKNAESQHIEGALKQIFSLSNIER